MPYKNVPEDLWDKMDSCVEKVMAKDGSLDKESAVAICYTSVVEGKELASSHKASSDPGDYLIVEDPEKSTTWHLQVRTDGKPDHGLMGGAWAALHEGHRGNKYEGPGKTEAISKLRKMYESEDLPVPGEKALHPSWIDPFLTGIRSHR